MDAEVRRHGSNLKRVEELGAENSNVGRTYAELALDYAAMTDLIVKSCRTGAEARGGAVPGGGTRVAAAPVL